jgi:phosphopentomutase
MARAFLIVMDSVGCGGAADAASYGDAGADTLGHIAQACAAGLADRVGLRQGRLSLPFLHALGLSEACRASSGVGWPDLGPPGRPRGQWGYAVETAKGKDTPSGHWEMAGCPLDFAWQVFPDTRPAFPESLPRALIAQGNLPGLLGDKHSNGVAIIDEFGAAHIESGKPIVYTSADSVIQIAAHEDPAIFGLERLYALCAIGRRLADPLNVGRVIARPFVGSPEAGFKRTGNRRDYAIPPPRDTILDVAQRAGRDIVSVGKIGDIFAHRATGRAVKATGNMALFDAMLDGVETVAEGGLLFANFVDFDSEYGHRRDVAGYAACLEAFDARLPELEAKLKPGDLVILTADHGNDPTWRGTDHTREHVPVLAFGPDLPPAAIGCRKSFADIGETVLAHLRLPLLGTGTAWL